MQKLSFIIILSRLLMKQNKSTKTIKHEFENGKRVKIEKQRVRRDMKGQGRNEIKNASKLSLLVENELLKIG